ncbi:hypothetical protein MAR_003069, partial [Mya arenaria]
YGHGKSCGVCVIIINDKINLDNFQTDFDGQFNYLDLNVFDFKSRLCNVHAPNVPGERNEYFSSIKRFFLKEDVFDSGILPCSMSDHNFIYVKLKINNNINYSKCKNTEYHKELRNFIKQYQDTPSVAEKICIKYKLNELNSIKRRKRVKSNVYEIDDNNIVKKSSLEILDSFRKFYKTLYTAENVDSFLSEMFLNDFPKISTDDNVDLTKPITINEIEYALKQMDHNKTPGS